jgi:uncharacterized protein YabN with tetrapyrrole methylase and pyrophosphatase domain
MNSPVEQLVQVMDQLRSPGGCPWDAQQTHESLARYLLEETYEALEAMDQGDLGSLREELGDLLLQVVFHARIAQEADATFSLDAIAQGVIDKLPIFPPYHLDQCGWLANRYAEAIEAEPAIKQQLLSEPDPLKRMEAVALLVE